MKDVQLLLSDVNDKVIKITGIIGADAELVKVARLFPAVAGETVIQADKVAETLDDAVTKAAAGASISGDVITFKHPIVIQGSAQMSKSASDKTAAYKIDDRGLSKALEAVTAGTLTKEAQNAFCDDLVAAIDASKEDGQKILNLSMPLKIEFKDEATKQAFMGLGRKRARKDASVKLARQVRSLYRSQLIDLAVSRLTGKK